MSEYRSKIELLRRSSLRFGLFLEFVGATIAEGINAPSLLDEARRARLFVTEKTPFDSLVGDAPKVRDVIREIPEFVEGTCEIALPFQSCWFEAHNGLLMWQKTKQSRQHCLCFGILVSERGPGQFIVTSLLYDIDEKDWAISRIESWTDPVNDRFVRGAVGGMIRLIQNSKIGSETVNVRTKISICGEKYVHKTKSIIRIVKGRQQDARPYLGTHIDWSHRWEVMGHWRKVQGIGKNRIGEYDTDGYTWIVPHTKGPEGKPVIQKIRIIPGIAEAIA